MILRRYLDSAGAQIPHRMIRAAMAKGQLVRPRTTGERKELVAQADPEDGQLIQQRRDGRDRIRHRLWIAGTEGSIEFASTDSLSLFLGNAPQVIGGGG